VDVVVQVIFCSGVSGGGRVGFGHGSVFAFFVCAECFVVSLVVVRLLLKRRKLLTLNRSVVDLPWVLGVRALCGSSVRDCSYDVVTRVGDFVVAFIHSLVTVHAMPVSSVC